MNEAVVTEKELPQGYKNTYDKAVAAIKMSNHGYAVELLLSILKDVPAFLDGRRVLRQMEVTVNGGKKKFLDTSSVKLRKSAATVKKDPVAAIFEIEEVLKEDPMSMAANMALFEAANAASMPRTAAFALETALKGKPGDTKLGHRLAEFLMAHDEPEQAIKIYEHILKHDNADGEARRGLTNSNARLSMKRTKLDQEGTNFRSLLKSSKDAKQLEDMSRVGATKDQLLEQIAHLAPEYEANPNDINVVRKIADLYERMEDWEQALSYFSWAYQLSNGDSALENKVHRIQDRLDEIHIKQLSDYLEANPDSEDAEARRAELAHFERQRSEKLVTVAKERVDRNPTDPQLRYEYGTHLYGAGYSREAIPELQRAKSNPHIRHKAMLMLARCYAGGKMYDLAFNQLQEAEKEMVTMDSTKKELLYEMGGMMERQGKPTEALEYYKQIYAVDYGYRDVAARVEGAYGG